MRAHRPLAWLAWPACVALGLVTGAIGVRVTERLMAPSAVHADPAYRAARAAGDTLSPAEWQRTAAREERARVHLGLPDDRAVREWVGERAASFQPTDDDLRALWEEHRDVFGARTFDQSRAALDRLARLRHVRQQLEQAGGPR